MSAIFLSHSSQDNAISAEVGEYLRSVGHRSIFLDFDPNNGIPPGRNWEQELYHRLRSCQAVLVLCSEASMASKWCFAEITHARALGKPLIPIKVEPCEILSVLSDVQVLDLNGNREETYRRLWRGLKEVAGLDPRSALDWDGSRPPYPGLLSFEREDAAIFFGRDREIEEGLERLRSLQRLGGARMLIVLGGSGSGKSSLVRAGLLPNLELERDGWLLLPPFRPQPRPVPKTDPFKELALALAESLREHGRTRDWQEIQDTLVQAAEAEPVRGDLLEELIEELRIASGRRRATVLLVVDQLEELFTNASAEQTTRFLALLQAALSEPGTPLMLIGTLRSDFLPQLQQHSVGRELDFEVLLVPSISTDQWARIIEGPAEKAGIRLEAGLVNEMVRDTATDDALPLLAFTLRELWERYGDDGLLSIEEYRDKLGGLAGSVTKASEAVFTAQRFSQEVLVDLRTAFSSLVKVNQEGQFVRRTARWADLPERAHPVLERFVQARLLVLRNEGGEREVEVAHEALIRNWERLRDLLNADREFLLWRNRLRVAQEEWERTGSDEGALLRGLPLAEAKRWLEQRSPQLSEGERVFITRSLQAEQGERRRRRMGRMATVAAALALPLLGVFAVRAGLAREELRATAILNAAESEQEPLVASLLLTELMQKPLLGRLFGRTEPAGGAALARRLVGEAGESLPLAVFPPGEGEEIIEVAFTPAGVALVVKREDGRLWLRWPDGERDSVEVAGHAVPVRNAVFSPDGERLLTVAEDDGVRMWRTTDGREVPQVPGALPPVTSAAFSRDGSLVAVGLVDGTVRVWHPEEPSEVETLGEPTQESVLSVAFDHQGTRVVTTSLDGMVRIWPLAGGGGQGATLRHSGGVWAAAFSPDGPGGGRVVIAEAGHARVCSADLRACGRVLPHEHPVWKAVFSADGSRIATASEDQTVRVWDAATGEQQFVLRTRGAAMLSAAFSPDGSQLLTVSGDGVARLWQLGPRDPLILRGHGDQVWSAAFDAGGRRVVSGAENGTVRVWSLSGNQAPVAASPYAGPVSSVAFSRDGSRVVIVSTYGSIQVCGADLTDCRTVLEHEGSLSHVAISPDGSQVVGASGDGTAHLWRVEGNREPVVLRGHTAAVLSAAFDESGRRVVTASEDRTARLWEVATGAKLEEFRHPHWVRRAAISHDGRRVATAAADHVVRVWVDANTHLVLGRHGGMIKAIAFSPDDRRVLTASDDGTARIWPADGRGLATELAVGSVVQSAAFSRDGRWVVTASDDGLVRVWRAEWNAMLEYLRAATTACLDADQRQSFFGESARAAKSAFNECQRHFGRRRPPN